MLFFRHEVKFLGHVVHEEGLQTDPTKIKKKSELSGTELRSFLGVCNYYKKFVNGYAYVLAPFQNALKNLDRKKSHKSIDIE